MRPIADGLFTDETPPRLIGGRNHATGRIVFPCPSGAEYEPYPLKREGTLWSYTIQRYRPKSPPYAGPEAFKPWPIAYIALEDETMVEARLANVDFDGITIGMKLEMFPVPLDPNDSDSPHIPAFRPVASA
jgi:uncharacterized OB-fold protein